MAKSHLYLTTKLRGIQYGKKSKLPDSKSPLNIAIKKSIHEGNSEIVHAALLDKSIKKAINIELSQPKHNELRAEIYTRKRKLPEVLIEKIEAVDVEPMPKKLRFS